MSIFSSIDRPTTIGGTIATPTSTTLAALDVGGLPIGTEVWNADVGAFFKLTVSTAALVTDSVVAVKDTTGSRWIVVAGGGGVADGVSIDGEGTEAEPFSVIPAYVAGLNGFTRIAQTVTGPTMTITVDGETEQVIEVICYHVNANAGASTITVQPNAAATEAIYQETGSASNDVPFGAHGAVGLVGFAGASGSGTFRFTMYLKAGSPRFYFGQYTSLSNVGTITNNSGYGGLWTETVDPITSLVITSDRADGLASGSLVLWRSFPAA